MRLSVRELQIAQGVFGDQDQETIAQALDLPLDVVYRALQRIYIKLHIGSRAELIVRVMSEYLAYVADQPQSEISGVPYWPIKEIRQPQMEKTRAVGIALPPF